MRNNNLILVNNAIKGALKNSVKGTVKSSVRNSVKSALKDYDKSGVDHCMAKTTNRKSSTKNTVRNDLRNSVKSIVNSSMNSSVSSLKNSAKSTSITDVKFTQTKLSNKNIASRSITNKGMSHKSLSSKNLSKKGSANAKKSPKNPSNLSKNSLQKAYSTDPTQPMQTAQTTAPPPTHSIFLSNFANILTFFRILLVPFIVLLLLSNTKLCDFLSAICFFVAIVTDYFDGYVARKLSIVSRVGEFLDPVADKLLVLNTFFILGYRDFFYSFDVILVFIIISRDIFVSDLRNFSKFSVSKIAKFKTFFQMLALMSLMFGLIINYFDNSNNSIILGDYYYTLNYIHFIFRVFLSLSAVFSILSLVNYLIYCFDSSKD